MLIGVKKLDKKMYTGLSLIFLGLTLAVSTTPLLPVAVSQIYQGGGQRKDVDQYPTYPLNKRISMDEAVKIAKGYLDYLGDPNIELDEITEFQCNFYVVYIEKDTGIGAFEMLIDPYTGGVHPEPGPNMMWNTKYGMHGGIVKIYTSTHLLISEEQAKRIAQRYLNRVMPESEAEDVHPFYGYYTVHITSKGEVQGMLSVNAYTGEVWYHSWHGKYIGKLELKSFEKM